MNFLPSFLLPGCCTYVCLLRVRIKPLLNLLMTEVGQLAACRTVPSEFDVSAGPRLPIQAISNPLLIHLTSKAGTLPLCPFGILKPMLNLSSNLTCPMAFQSPCSFFHYHHCLLGIPELKLYFFNVTTTYLTFWSPCNAPPTCSLSQWHPRIHALFLHCYIPPPSKAHAMDLCYDHS